MKGSAAVLLLSGIFWAVLADARPGEVVTKDGRRWTGEITSPFGVLEWRRDIAVAEGTPFFLSPERKGRVALQDIREIRRISAEEAPVETVELEDGRTARLLLRYRIRLNSGRTFTISDFITLDNYYVEVSSGEEAPRRIYLTTISSLVFRDISSPRAAPQGSVVRPATMPRTPARTPPSSESVQPIPSPAPVRPAASPLSSPSLSERESPSPSATSISDDTLTPPSPPRPIVSLKSPVIWMLGGAVAVVLVVVLARSPVVSETLFALRSAKRRPFKKRKRRR